MISDTLLNTLRTTRDRFGEISANMKSTFQSISEAKYDSKNTKYFLDGAYVLTKGEKDLIRNRFGLIIPCLSRGYSFYQAMKKLDRFNLDYLPSCYYYPYILDALNPIRWKKLLCNKSLFKVIYQCGVKQPVTPLRSIGGVYFDSDSRPVSTEAATRIIREIDSPILVKPSTDTNSGSGIRFIDRDALSSLCEEVRSRKIIDNHGLDFVIQLPVSQSSETKKFNRTSLNCMRITTLNLNGVVSAHSMTLKCGPSGSKVDNIGSGKRGVIVGVNADGLLSEFGFYGNGEMAEAHCGIVFKGNKINAFNKVIDAAKSLHSMIDSCHVIGWDIALDAENDPVLIEGNTNYPGISLEQMCSGPIFGNRMEEVVSYVADIQRIRRGGVW